MDHPSDQLTTFTPPSLSPNFHFFQNCLTIASESYSHKPANWASSH